jgi:hypothetical protein
VRICLNQELIRRLPFFLHLRDLEQLSDGLQGLGNLKRCNETWSPVWEM